MSNTVSRTEVMKRIFVALLALVLVAGLTGQAGAGTLKKKRLAVATSGEGRGTPLAANGYSGYYERLLDKVPFGSQLWWRVYDSQPRGR